MTADFAAKAPADMPMVEISNLVKRFLRPNGKEIRPVDNISLRVEREELVALLGPSGCGKTTLLRCVAGLERPDSGRITINGEVVFCSEQQIFVPANKRRLSMVFQSFALWPHMTVEKNIGYPLETRGLAREEIVRRVSEVVRLVNIEGIEAQYPGRISGGQQQRVALARALVGSSDVILFDEPMSSVDAQVRTQLRFELKRLQQTVRFSGLFVTHDQGEAMELGQRIAVLNEGRVEALGSPQAIYDHPASEYVANFVGMANIWPGRVVVSEAGGAVVETELGMFRTSAHGGIPGENATVSIVLRPERARLTPERPAGATNSFEVTVESKIFFGPHTQYVVVAGQQIFRVWDNKDSGSSDFAEGSTAWIQASPDALHLIAQHPVSAGSPSTGGAS